MEHSPAVDAVALASVITLCGRRPDGFRIKVAFYSVWVPRRRSLHSRVCACRKLTPTLHARWATVRGTAGAAPARRLKRIYLVKGLVAKSPSGGLVHATPTESGFR